VAGDPLVKSAERQLRLGRIWDMRPIDAGSQLAVASDGASLSLIDPQSLDVTATLATNVGSHHIEAGDFSPDGKWLAVAARERVHLLERADGRVVGGTDAGEWTTRVAFDAGSRMVASACCFQAGAMVRIDAVSDAGLTPLHEIWRADAQSSGSLPVEGISSLEWSADGRLLSFFECAGDRSGMNPPGWCGNVVVIDVASGRVLWTRPVVAEGVGEPRAWPGTVVFLPGGRLACSTPGAVWILDERDGQFVRSIPAGGEISALTAGPDGRVYYSLGDDTLNTLLS
jgi:WD40 repeat protein